MVTKTLLNDVCWNNINKCVHIKDSTSFCGSGKQCLCACIIDTKDKNSAKILSIGFNKYNIDNRSSVVEPNNCHAEVDACMKLQFNKTPEKKIKVNLIVFRSNPKKNRLLMAKPCNNCIKTMNYMIHKKGYILKNVYYTDDNGNICSL
tara:strand:- start:15716 stop:16159 length:444 start_codon:yes stop_codon:yes gene_type:complete